MNTSNPERYHFIGIGGIGMSALATILLQKGLPVSGSDIAASHTIETLKQLGAVIYLEHAEANIKEPAVVVYSSAVKADNPEMCCAKRCDYPLMHRSELLHFLMKRDAPLLVTGTHGKTTTSALLAHLLMQTDLHPSFAIGGILKNTRSNGGYGIGPYFVAEADESDGSFLTYTPFGAIITNIEEDHLDHWKDTESLVEGFRAFATRVKSEQHLFWCGDDDRIRRLALKGVSYGFEEENALQILSYSQKEWKNSFDVAFEKKIYRCVEVPLIGGHNVLNAAAVFGLALRLNIPEEAIRAAFETFEGVARRADFKGESRSIAAYDDYAHHPTEVFATLRAIKHAVGKRRLVVIFQPHRYTRTRDLFAEFSTAFAPADVVVLTDIYSAGESPIEGITTQNLLKKVAENSQTEVHYCRRSELPRFMPQLLKAQDVLVTMGAGDITKVGPEILAQLSS